MRRNVVQRLLKLPTSSRRLPLRLVQAQFKTATAFFSHSHRSTYQHQPYRSTAPPDYYPVGPPRSVPFLRSLLWAVVFGTTGFGTLTWLMAVAYRKEGEIQPGTTSDVRLSRRAVERVGNHPVVQALLADPEFEIHFPYAVTPEQEEKLIISTITGSFIECDPHFVETALRPYRGMNMMVFWNQHRHVLVMVVSPGFGLGGEYIGTVHNGAVTTAVHESMQMVARRWFPQGLSFNLSDLEVSAGSPLPSRGIFCIACHPACSIDTEQLASAVDVFTAAKASDLEIERSGLIIWPDWFDPQDWNIMANSIVAQVVVAPSGRLLNNRDAFTCYLNAVGRFQVSESEDWPPPQSPRRKAYHSIGD
ncbi:hypothetical protein EDD37DRAFT_328200 [Exophiala viscosa]|uniref:uncharacterized protein n=1 Tax=Exophiala viscosa TaxID=2486360 RepID=UPI00219BFC3B|nr:hypothetical protein EDD37DRAFT_328200 [Exophiala viscosa]